MIAIFFTVRTSLTIKTRHTQLFSNKWKLTTPQVRCILDAVGSWQIILPMPNLERPFKSNKESEAVLRCLQ